MRLKSYLFILWRDEANDTLTINDTMQSSTNHLHIHSPVFYFADPGPVAGPVDREICACAWSSSLPGLGRGSEKTREEAHSCAQNYTRLEQECSHRDGTAFGTSITQVQSQTPGPPDSGPTGWSRSHSLHVKPFPRR